MFRNAVPSIDRPTTRRAGASRRGLTSAWVAACLFGAMLLPHVAHASRPGRFSVDDYASFAEGRFLGTQLAPDGTVRLGPQLRGIAAAIGGPVLSAVRGADGVLYIGTAGPARVFRVDDDGALTLHAEFEAGLVSALVREKNNLVAVTAPKGSVHRLPLSPGRGKPPVKPTSTLKVKQVDVMLDAAMRGNELLIVGGGDEGVLFNLKNKKINVMARTEEKTLRTITVAPKGRVLVGGGEKGRVYRLEGRRLRAVYDSDAEEVTEILVDKAGQVFASIVNTSGTLAETATKEKNTDKEDGTKKKKKRKARKVKGTEVVRIDTDDDAEVLYSSKKHAAYALAFRNGRVLVGTGPYGRLLSLNKKGGERPAILGEVGDADEITVLLPDAARLIVGTAHAGAVAEMLNKVGASGRYRSAALDAKRRARFGAVTVRPVLPMQSRTGFTDAPDESWGGFIGASKGQQRSAPARYIQLEATLKPGQALSALRVSYLTKNRAPVIQRIDVVVPHVKVTPSEREGSASRSVTFGETPFKKFTDVPQTLIPHLGERPSGKQVRRRGWRTVYAYVEDADKDALQYAFSIRHEGGPWRALKERSDEPFASFDSSTFAAGRYEIQVEVDDALSNGFERSERDDRTSPSFRIDHDAPRFTAASAQRSKRGFAVKLDVRAAAPLALVQCAVGDSPYYPLDPDDGLLDGQRETFSAVLPLTPEAQGVACRAVDENLNDARVMLPVR